MYPLSGICGQALRPRTSCRRPGGSSPTLPAPAREPVERVLQFRRNCPLDENRCRTPRLRRGRMRLASVERPTARTPPGSQFENARAAVLIGRWLDGPVAQRRGATRNERPDVVPGHDVLDAAHDPCATRGAGASHTSKKEEAMRRILLVVGIAFAALTAATLAVTAAAPAGGPPRYLDAHAPIKDRWSTSRFPFPSWAWRRLR